ncbi:MAG: metallophosphoesterase [Pirellulales bacterium]|nr:metallophosphoesterase [Pirellulales bacterium]
MRQRRLILAAVIAAAMAPGVVVSAREPRPADAPRPLFTFGLVADVQYGDKPDGPPRFYRSSLDRLRECVAEFNRRKVDFTVQLGDIIDGHAGDENAPLEPGQTKSLEDLDRVLAEFAPLDRKLYHVVGNHCLNAGREALQKKLGLERAFYDFAPEGVQGWRLVVLDGNDAGYGVLGKEQIQWLEDALAKARDRRERVILLNHFALFKESAARHRMKSPKPVDRIIDRAGCVVAYFAGHDHAGGYAEVRGVHHVTLQGMVETPGGNAYAVVEVFPDRIEIRGFGKVPSRSLTIRNPSPLPSG